MKKTARRLTLLAAGISLAGGLVYTQIQAARLNQALCVAASQGDTARVERLLRRGANPNAVGFIPNTDGGCEDSRSEDCGPSPALFLAIIGSPGYDFDPTETAAALLRAGADVNVKAENNYGSTALMWATSSRLTKLLLAHGAKVDLRDHDGQTALMHAAQIGTVDAVQALLAAGADVNVRDHRGQTALGLAQPWDHPEYDVDVQRLRDVQHNIEVRRIAEVLKKQGARL